MKTNSAKTTCPYEQSIQNSSQHRLGNEFLKAKKHFLYKTSHHSEIAYLSKDLLAGLEDYIQDCGIGAVEIDIMPKKLILKSESPAEKSFYALCDLLGMVPEKSEVVVCQQAMPHVDSSFKGEIFRSAVLSTGNDAGYLVGCISEPSGRFSSTSGADLEPIRTDLCVQTGDVFLLNPQHIHYAMPLELSSNCLLVLLQQSLEDTTQEQRDAICTQYPPSFEEIDVSLL